MDSVASGTPYTFQQDSAPAHRAKLVHILAEEECAQLLGLQQPAPQQARPETMRLLLVEEVGEEVCATHHSNVASLKASIKSEMNRAGSCRGLHGLWSSGVV
ncbi:Transposable element tcb2 transposase [Caligus rogercresseyi]|uniref:Transposable element tcb2 transposase n=1 Tax=Caligus rogercresseyi TaxID=217165 RepID=A0A7T8HJ72_CALRO|nr:Transposable element tcb2 transposase [Caligus rogercresseyi]